MDGSTERQCDRAPQLHLVDDGQQPGVRDQLGGGRRARVDLGGGGVRSPSR
jgi:hypothetical protein